MEGIDVVVVVDGVVTTSVDCLEEEEVVEENGRVRLKKFETRALRPGFVPEMLMRL